MIRFIILLTLVFTSPAFAVNLTSGVAKIGKEIEIIIPGDVNTEGLVIGYYLNTKKGGWGSGIRNKPYGPDQPNISNYIIPISNETAAKEFGRDLSTLDFRGVLVEGVKFIIYVPGYQFINIDIPSLKDSPKTINLDFIPLPEKIVIGKIKFQKEMKVDKWKVLVLYHAGWSHEFDGVISGPPLTIILATAEINENGRFSFTYPDFVQGDIENMYISESRPWIRSSAIDFSLWGNHSVILKPIGGLEALVNILGEIPITNFPDEVSFEAIQR